MWTLSQGGRWFWLVFGFPFLTWMGLKEDLGSWWGHSRSRNQQQDSLSLASSAAYPWSPGAHPELCHTIRAIPSRKSSSLLPAGAASPWGGRGHCLQCEVSLSPPTHHMGASLSRPASLTPSHPTALPVSLLLQTQFISEGTAHGAENTAVTNLTDMEVKESKPGHRRGRMETSTEQSLSRADFLHAGSAVNVF